jgi:hypothetical protein
MSTLTRTRPTYAPDAILVRAFDAGKLVWEADMLVPAPVREITPAPAPVVETTPEFTDDQLLGMFRNTGNKTLRALAYTPTGRERRGGEAARAEITRRATKRAAKRA